jgi:CheY-like chemotaxis protein
VILIVDDEPDIAEELADLIESTGREVIYETSALSALKVAKNQSLDLVITDMRMPDIDGAELIRRIHDSYADREKPGFIVVSGHLGASDDLSHLHNIDYTLVPKPIDVNVLLSLIAAKEQK